MSVALRFVCPDCGTKLAPVESMDVATQAIRRTCRRCPATWSLVVSPMQAAAGSGLRMDVATIARVRPSVRPEPERVPCPKCGCLWRPGSIVGGECLLCKSLAESAGVR